jgi:hypothetical protein
MMELVVKNKHGPNLAKYKLEKLQKGATMLIQKPINEV